MQQAISPKGKARPIEGISSVVIRKFRHLASLPTRTPYQCFPTCFVLQHPAKDKHILRHPAANPQPIAICLKF